MIEIKRIRFIVVSLILLVYTIVGYKTATKKKYAEIDLRYFG